MAVVRVLICAINVQTIHVLIVTPIVLVIVNVHIVRARGATVMTQLAQWVNVTVIIAALVMDIVLVMFIAQNVQYTQYVTVMAVFAVAIPFALHKTRPHLDIVLVMANVHAMQFHALNVPVMHKAVQHNVLVTLFRVRLSVIAMLFHVQDIVHVMLKVVAQNARVIVLVAANVQVMVHVPVMLTLVHIVCVIFTFVHNVLQLNVLHKPYVIATL